MARARGIWDPPRRSLLDLIATDRASWDAAALPSRPFLQSWAWGSFQSRWGWRPERWLLTSQGTASGRDVVGGVQVLWRRLPGGFRWGYVPKGPALAAELTPGLCRDLSAALRRRFASPTTLFVRVEPPVVDRPPARRALALAGLRTSPKDVQPRHTVLVDLDRSEDEILRGMHPKTRYNVRLAARRGVTVRPAGGDDDVERFLHLHQETVARDRYAGHTPAYLRAFLRDFADCAELLVARARGENVAGIVVTYTRHEAIYLYGASGERFREDMPNYALQWEAMRRARARGCRRYDMWGVAPTEAPDEPMAGLRRFKQGFGQLVSWLGCWDVPLSPLYPLWRAAESRRATWRRRQVAQ